MAVIFLQVISNFSSWNSDCVCAYTCVCTHAHICMKASTCALRHARLKSKSGVLYYHLIFWDKVSQQAWSLPLWLDWLTRKLPTFHLCLSTQWWVREAFCIAWLPPRSQDPPKPFVESLHSCVKKEPSFRLYLGLRLSSAAGWEQRVPSPIG